MACVICGLEGSVESRVLWPELIAEWTLAEHEVSYIDRQQGKRCSNCGANLRSQVLSKAIIAALGLSTPLAQTIRTSGARILEINEAGTLHAVLGQAPSAFFGAYPEIDMQTLPYEDASFDLVVHSDTLEHVEQPLIALSECCRVLKPGGTLCYTVPVIVGRLSRRRDGLPPSYHGAPGDGRDDHLVFSEYGADMWTEPLRAGFASVEVFAIDFPDALAMSARRAVS
jgi:SAM-dependent methyltransferase